MEKVQLGIRKQPGSQPSAAFLERLLSTECVPACSWAEGVDTALALTELCVHGDAGDTRANKLSALHTASVPQKSPQATG